jgi:hypothetical protein
MVAFVTKAVLSFVVVIVNVHLQRQSARYALLLLFLLKDQLAVDFADVTHRLPVTV